MNLQNTPWDYQEHDRVISILAWVVVVVLVIYASVFFYKQITTAPERPHDLTLAQGTEPVTATAPPVLPPVDTEPAQPVEPPPVKPPVVSTPVNPPEPPPVKPPVVATRPPAVTHPVRPPPPVEPPPVKPPVATVTPPEPVSVKPPAAVTPPVQPPVTSRPPGERMTLKIGTFMSAGEAVRSGVGLGIDGHTFSPVRDPLTNRYTLHFGEFTGWKDAIVVMDKIRAKDASLDVVVWPLPTGSPAERPEPRQPAAERPAPEPAAEPAPTPRPVAAVRPQPAPARPARRVEPEPVETPRAAKHSGPTGPYVVRVASYKQVANATGMVRTLLESGYRASMDETTVKGERWFRVHAAGFDSLGEAREARQRIVSLSKSADGAVVVKVP